MQDWWLRYYELRERIPKSREYPQDPGAYGDYLLGALHRMATPGGFAGDFEQVLAVTHLLLSAMWIYDMDDQ